MSLSQQKLKEYAKLKQKKYRTLRKKLIVEGVRGIRELIQDDTPWVKVDSVLYTPDFLSDELNEKLLITLKDQGTKIYEVSKKDLGRLSETVTPQNIFAIVNQWQHSVQDFLKRKSVKLIVAANQIREPGNLGVLIRTCDWFGVDGLLLDKGTVEIWNPKVVRASMGSMVRIPFVEGVELTGILSMLSSNGFSIVGTDASSGDSIKNFEPRFPIVIVFGNEAEGITPEVEKMLHNKITIPRYGNAESLNVGVAAGVILGTVRMRGE